MEKLHDVLGNKYNLRHWHCGGKGNLKFHLDSIVIKEES